jgi:glycosyltransferase involved in cell wall biosynthesis
LNNPNRIAIVWEQNEWGGVDSYLEYLLNSWPNQSDQIVILHNKGNKGAIRLKNLLSSNENVTFREIDVTFKYYPWLNMLTIFKKILSHIFIPILFLSSVIKYKKLFDHEKFDVVIGQNGGYPGSYGVLSSLFAAKKAGVKVVSLVVHHAATKPILMHGWFRMIIEKKLGNGILSSVIAVSNVTKDSLIRNTYFFDQQKCHVIVIENGIPIPNKRVEKVSNPHDNFRIGMLGRLEPYKGHDDFLCALSMVSQECLDKIKVQFFGGYTDTDYVRLTSIIKNLDLEGKVDILGYVDSSVSRIITDLDLVVMVTKTFEGFGLTVIEALHQNVPVLATNVGVVSDLFPNGGELIVDVGDFNEMARQIEKIVLSNENDKFIPQHIKDKLWKYDSKHMANRYYQHFMFELIK